MKKVLLVLSVVIGLSANAQEWDNTWPMGEIANLVGQQIKGEEKSEGLQKYGFGELFSKETMGRKEIWEQNNSYKTEYSKVANKIFTVVSAEILDSKYCKVELLTEDNKTIWYKYDFTYKHKWEFLTQGFRVSDEYFCSTNVSETYDEFDDKYTYRSSSYSYMFIRVNNSYYLRITAPAAPLSVQGESGVDIILKDGSRLSWPNEKIELEVSDSNSYSYDATAFIRLSAEDLSKLSKSNPKKARLYVVGRGFGDQDYARELTCIMNK